MNFQISSRAADALVEAAVQELREELERWRVASAARMRAAGASDCEIAKILQHAKSMHDAQLEDARKALQVLAPAPGGVH